MKMNILAIADALPGRELLARLNTVAGLSPHLTPENHQVVLGHARLRTRPQIEALVAELAPQPDVPSSVRKLPALVPTPPTPFPSPAASASPEPTPAPLPAPAVFVPPERPVVRASAPERYRVQFTIGEERLSVPGRIDRAARAISHIDLHHGGEPYARGGLATVDNLSLHCRRHNQDEAELIFGPNRRRDGSRR